ncbi:MAG TPA: flagellar hook-basal body complex protein [Conexibacter sp.]
MYSAISGLKVNQTMLDTTANNLANVNTIGYKGERTTFQDSLAEMQRGASAPGQGSGGSNALQIGLGAQLGSIDNVMTGGAPQTTGNPLDVYIQGTGWFRVGNGTPPAVPTNFQWTRAGNFKTNPEGFVTTADGHYVVGKGVTRGVDADGNPTYAPDNATDSYIQVPRDGTDVSVGADGSVSYVDATTGDRVVAGFIALGTFPNEAGLQRNGGSMWSTSAASGAATVSTPGVGGTGSTVGGMLEMSNVDLATEFTTMITAERGFEANSRTISTADEMLQDLVNLKR